MNDLKTASILVFALLAISSCNPVDGLVSMGTNKILGSSGIQSRLNKPVITTDFSDAQQDKVLDNAFGNDQLFGSLQHMPRSETGGYLLAPGLYEMTSKSYCIKAGTHGPSQGDGYLWAPLKGKAKETMLSIVRNSEQHPLIGQHRVQILLWAILAKAKFSDLSPDLKLVAAKLLTPAQLLELNGGAMSLIPDSVLANAISSMPRAVQLVLEAENKMRAMLYNAATTYEELERIAVLLGAALVDRPDIQRGQWSQHAGGYFVRYFPKGYTRTKVQVYVPENIKVSRHRSFHSSPYEFNYRPVVNFDAPNDVAVPANRGAQRLLQSNEPSGGPPIQLPPDPPGGPCSWTPLPGGPPVQQQPVGFGDCKSYRSFVAGNTNMAKAHSHYKTVVGKLSLKRVGSLWQATVPLQVEPGPRHRIEMKVPSFTTITKQDCEATKNYLDSVYAHERGHMDMYKDSFDEFNKKKFFSGRGKTKEEAIAAMHAAVLKRKQALDQELSHETKAYDATTHHGWTQEQGPSMGYPGGENIEFEGCGLPPISAQPR